RCCTSKGRRDGAKLSNRGGCAHHPGATVGVTYIGFCQHGGTKPARLRAGLAHRRLPASVVTTSPRCCERIEPMERYKERPASSYESLAAGALLCSCVMGPIKSGQAQEPLRYMT